MTSKLGHIINGKTQMANNDKFLAITNPASGQEISQVNCADQHTVEAAVASAQAAFPTWSQTPPQKRARILFRYKQLLEDNMEELAKIVTQEHGKTLEDARGSVLRGIELVEFTCSMPYLLRGSFSENVANDMDCYTLRQALGVCVGISPFNFPVMVPAWMIIPAIAYGNTFVLKPSEQDPTAPYRMVELLKEAGLPDGVVNIVNGDKDCVEQLIKHPDVKAVTAVASSPVAKSIHDTATQHGKRSATYGGAKNHAVVMPDADIEQTGQALIGAAYGSAGERCMALSVVVAVGDKVADDLVAYLKNHIPNLKIGAGDQANIDMGPLISQTHLEHVKSYIEQGTKEGAELVVDGREQSFTQGGFFLGASLFDKVKADMRIYQEEIFGPVLCVLRVNSFDEAVELVSNHPFGNGTAIFTNDGEVARSYVSRVQAGMVGVNVAIPVPIAYHSFGGWKESSFGDLGMHGDQSVQFYTKLKTVTSRWPKGLRAQAEFNMPHFK